MDLLNKIVTYWLDCIKNEDIYEKGISILSRKKAILYPFKRDEFIFNQSISRIPINNNTKLIEFYKYVISKDFDIYYGYPILFYFDDRLKKYLLAPILIIKIKYIINNNNIYLEKDEQYPICGIQALSKLGLRTEEIADINQNVINIFKRNIHGSSSLLNKFIEILSKETELKINEKLDFNNLTNDVQLNKNSTPGIYNKSLIYTSESHDFNINLIQDLLELRDKNDLINTSLSYLIDQDVQNHYFKKQIIIPFPANEYQIQSIQRILSNKFTVITGPPGTGKSQFISNLLINLFLNGKSVLFVSHTNEAVNVVNDKINNNFKHLITRTGIKKFRQELKGNFNKFLIDSDKFSHNSISISHLKQIWRYIHRLKHEIINIDALQRQYEELCIQKSMQKREYKNLILKKFFNILSIISLNYKLNRVNRQLKSSESKIKIEKKTWLLEKEYFKKSKEYVKNIYIKQILGNGNDVGKVKTFLNEVDANRGPDRNIDSYYFLNAIQMLKIWSCTLKSLRRTFPLLPGIFDYVVFDEASQVDLPSAAPALYRAKNVVVVGDPMQLTHIAGITKDIDYSIAMKNGITNYKDLYPSKVRYFDVSLYKSAENSLNQKPIFLTKHYRSTDQIIDLCNKTFYSSRLKILTNIDFSKIPNDLAVGVEWYDCEGVSNKHPSGSRYNSKEADLVFQIFRNIISKISDTNLTIGIVTPYSRQQDLIHEKITTSFRQEILSRHKVKILTAHKFQGSEKDIMIFSLVLASRGNGNSDRWYNIYPQILNVALSRARYLLCIVGDKKYCSSRKGILKELITNYENIKKEENIERYTTEGKFDSPTERYFYKKISKINFDDFGYKLIPKYVAKRYTLDFALIGKKKIDIECDGYQHEIIGGLPVLEDVERDIFLRKEGWEVIRIPNHYILNNPKNVIKYIIKRLN